jgi:hypothetical protein
MNVVRLSFKGEGSPGSGMFLSPPAFRCSGDVVSRFCQGGQGGTLALSAAFSNLFSVLIVNYLMDWLVT